MFSRLFIVSYLIYSTAGEEFNISSVFTPCVLSGDITECFSTTVRNAFQLLGTGKTPFKIPTIEPMELTSITVPKGGKSVNADQIYRNVKIHGITNMANVTADADILNLEFHVTSLNAKMLLTSDYEFKGEVLKRKVVGNGTLTINFENVMLDLLVTARLIPKKSDLYFNVTDVIIKLQPEKAHFKFTNVRENGKSADEEINRLINDNWKEVYQDVGETYHYAFGVGIKNWANQAAKFVTFASVFT